MKELDVIKRYKNTELNTLPVTNLYIKILETALNCLKSALHGLNENNFKVFYNMSSKANKIFSLLVEIFENAKEFVNDFTRDFASDFIIIYLSIEKKIRMIIKKRDKESLEKMVRITEKVLNTWQEIVENIY